MKGYILLGTMAMVLCFKSRAAAKTNTYNDSTLRVLTSGMRIIELDRAKGVVAKKYGFQYYSVAGCMVTPELLDSIKRENDITYAILEKKFGKDWENQFDAEVKRVIPIQKKVEELVEKQCYIIEKEQELAKTNRSLHFFINPLPDSRQCDVKVYAWETRDEEEVPVILFRMKVNSVKNKVELLSSNPEKMPFDEIY